MPYSASPTRWMPHINSNLQKILKLDREMSMLPHISRQVSFDVRAGNSNLAESLSVKGDGFAKGGLTQFWELFTMIPCAPKYLKRL